MDIIKQTQISVEGLAEASANIRIVGEEILTYGSLLDYSKNEYSDGTVSECVRASATQDGAFVVVSLNVFTTKKGTKK